MIIFVPGEERGGKGRGRERERERGGKGRERERERTDIPLAELLAAKASCDCKHADVVLNLAALWSDKVRQAVVLGIAVVSFGLEKERRGLLF